MKRVPERSSPSRLFSLANHFLTADCGLSRAGTGQVCDLVQRAWWMKTYPFPLVVKASTPTLEGRMILEE